VVDGFLFMCVIVILFCFLVFFWFIWGSVGFFGLCVFWFVVFVFSWVFAGVCLVGVVCLSGFFCCGYFVIFFVFFLCGWGLFTVLRGWLCFCLCVLFGCLIFVVSGLWLLFFLLRFLLPCGLLCGLFGVVRVVFFDFEFFGVMVLCNGILFVFVVLFLGFFFGCLYVS